MTSLTPSALQNFVAKLHALPPSKQQEVKDFIDFLLTRSTQPIATDSQWSMQSSAPAFDKVWDNPEDADYDLL